MANETILVVEDEEDLQELIRFNLTRNGYRVQCVSTGREALRAIRENQPNLIVLDLMLPEIDGMEICRSVKSDPSTKDIPVVMVTAKTEDSDVVAGLEIGADDYLGKPFSPSVLVARIRAQLRRRESDQREDTRSIQVHELSIHPGRHEVLADETAIDLSFTEFRILLALAEAPGWVLSRYQIVSKVRGDNTIVTDRSVDVHIANLRKKLGPYGRYVETVRGVGYRLKE